MDNIERLLALGLSQNEARVYSALIEVKAAKVSELETVCRMHRPNIYVALKRLARRGLVNGNRGKVGVFSASPPRLVFSERLQQTRELLRLQEESVKAMERDFARRAETRHAPPTIEVLRATPSEPSPGFEDRLQCLARAKREILFLTRRHTRRLKSKPLKELVTRTARVEEQALERGVRFRCVYQADFLEDPAARTAARAAIKAGEQVRVVDRLPVGLTVIDRRLAWFKPDSAEPQGIVYKVNDRSLAELLAQAFEHHWDRGEDAEAYMAGQDRAAGRRGRKQASRPGSKSGRKELK